MLAVAAGAWALLGRDENKITTGPSVSTSAPTAPVLGPVVPGTKPKPTVTATSTKPAAPTKAAATTASTKAPTRIGPVTSAPPAARPPVSAPVAKPSISAPQQGGTVAMKDYTFRVARGDTLWSFAQRALAATGRSTSNATTAAFVPRLFQSNSGVVGSDPNLIQPGQTIVWPTGL